MSAHRSQYSMVRLFRTVLPYSLLFAGPLAVAACAGGDSPVEPTAAPAGADEARHQHLGKGTIVFAWDSNQAPGKTDIYVMNADGSGLTRLTNAPEVEREPSWSWDNTRIAFSRERFDNVSKEIHPDVYLMDADGSNGRWLTPDPVSYYRYNPSWSPDGTKIVVSGGNYLELIDVATGTAQFVNAGGGGVLGHGATFLPTGDKLLAAWSTEVFTVNLDGTGRTVLETGPAGSWSEFPAYSPSGRKIAFVSNRTGDREIYVMNADGTGVGQVTKSAGDDTSPSWSPDGKRITFRSGRSGLEQIWSMGASGSNPIQIQPSGRFQADPAYSH